MAARFGSPIRCPKRRNRSARASRVRQLWGPSGVAVWSAPTIDPKRGVLYVTTGNNYSPPATDASDAVLAMDLATGRIVWTRQVTPRETSSAAAQRVFRDERGPDFDFGSSVLLVGNLLLAGQNPALCTRSIRTAKARWSGKPESRKGAARRRVVGHGQRRPIRLRSHRRWRTAARPRACDGSKRRRRAGSSTGRRRNDRMASRARASVRLLFRQSLPTSAAATAIPGVIFSGALDGHMRAYRRRTERSLGFQHAPRVLHCERSQGQRRVPKWRRPRGGKRDGLRGIRVTITSDPSPETPWPSDRRPAVIVTTAARITGKRRLSYDIHRTCRLQEPGAWLRHDVETKSRHYRIECLGGHAIRISGHPEYVRYP